MQIASWNINSIKARLPVAIRWIKEQRPDIVCLQELKCVDSAFPAEAFEDIGYNVAVHGQKTYNGVAILSLLPFDEVKAELPGDEDDKQARYLEARFSTGDAALTVGNIYLPNGNPVEEGSDKFPYKLRWMDRLNSYARTLLQEETPLVLCGDYNLIPAPEDVHDPAAWEGDALYRPESREKFRELLGLGFTDAFRAACNEDHAYTFWDYQRGAWQKDHGIRIDHHLLSPQAADRLATCHIDRTPRGWEKPSDHTPIIVTLDI